MAQDWRVHALVYFCGAAGDLLGAVLYWHLGLESFDMKQEDIIRMAQECGLIGMRPHLDGIYQEALAAFAALVAAAEREACAKLCEGMEENNLELRYEYRRAVLNCADAIRARGQA